MVLSVHQSHRDTNGNGLRAVGNIEFSNHVIQMKNCRRLSNAKNHSNFKSRLTSCGPNQTLPLATSQPWITRIQKADLQNNFGQRGLADTNPGGLGGIVTPRDISNSLVGTYRRLALQGLVENVDGYVINLQVARNASNRNRVDVYNPVQLVRPLDVLATNTTAIGGCSLVVEDIGPASAPA